AGALERHTLDARHRHDCPLDDRPRLVQRNGPLERAHLCGHLSRLPRTIILFPSSPGTPSVRHMKGVRPCAITSSSRCSPWCSHPVWDSPSSAPPIRPPTKRLTLLSERVISCSTRSSRR